MSQVKTPIILDVDTGIDDAAAIALASLSPRADLVAVTTVAGNTTIEHATRNSLDVIDMLGFSHVPLYRGASRPLARPLQTAAHVHGDNGIGGAALPASNRQPGEYKGPAAIIRLALERPGELTLVCLGPLTNLAIALNVQPDLPELLKSVVVMGGAYFVGGNISKAAEFNFYCDPEAASQVLTMPFPNIVAVGLDVTHQVALPRESWATAADHSSPVRLLLHEVFKESFNAGAGAPVYIHDALAVAVALDPSLLACELHTVTIQAGSDERGASRTGACAPVEVAVSVDGQRFLMELLRVFDLPQ